MGLAPVDQRPDRDDAARVDLVVRPVVVALDLVEIDRRGDSRSLVEVQQVAVQVRVVDDPPYIALEMPVVNGVETDQRAKEPPVRFHDPAAHQVAARGEAGFQFIERGKEEAARLFVGGLRRGEPGPVNAVVHGLVDERAPSLHLLAKRFGKKIDLRVPREGVEFPVEHPADVVLRIIDDAARIPVPEHRNRHPCVGVEGRIARRVGFAQKRKTVHRIMAEPRPVPERPPPFIAHRIGHRHADRLLQPLEVAENQRPARPGAGEGNIKMITPGGGGIRGGAVPAHLIPEPVFLPFEFSLRGLFICELGFGGHDG